MPGRLAVDFGTSNTMVAVWDEARQEGLPLHIPDLGQIPPSPVVRSANAGRGAGGEGLYPAEPSLSASDHEFTSLIPSLIHYGANERWIGSQVIQKGLEIHPNTYNRMKRYILNRTPGPNGRPVTYAEAGKDFLTAVLGFAAQQLDLGDEEIALTVPVEAFEHYENWLAGVAESVNLPRFRLLDEPSAAALGYGTHIQPGDVYLIFDFGGGTLDVSMVLIEEEAQALAERKSLVSKRCRVLGKAGADLGGTTIDQWLFEEVLRQNGRNAGDEGFRQINRALLRACEEVKMKLSFQERASLSVIHPETGAALGAEFTQNQFEALLDRQDAFADIDRTIRRAINASAERGYTEEAIKSVLMVGGSSQIPSVQRTLKRIFGQERVMLHRPFGAIASGAAAFVAGVDFYDHIQHNYAIRYVNRTTGEYDYRPLVNRGAPYPTPEPMARLTIKATYEGQTHLGLAIYEVGERARRTSTARMELVFDPSGDARLTPLTADEEERRTFFWMNETNPTFLNADPPAAQGEPRFEVSFSIDGNKRLLITARDLKSGKITHRDHPVVKLS